MRWLLLLLVACSGTTEEPDPPVEDSDPPEVFDTQLDCGALDRCGMSCTELSSDPLNCGSCGRTCVILQGEASCLEGACALEVCDPGWSDCDGDLDNGCEELSSCQPGAPCETECGTEGATDCGDNGCEPSCPLPEEICNGADDDCDGSCDEEVDGCRVAMHRARGPNGHDYGLDTQALLDDGATIIEASNYFWLYAAPIGTHQALYRCVKGDGSRFLTTASDCEGAGPVDVLLGYLAADGVCGAAPLYRLLSPTGKHFYTTSAPERDNAVNNLGFVAEGMTGYVWRSR